jgi:transposase
VGQGRHEAAFLTLSYCRQNSSSTESKEGIKTSIYTARMASCYFLSSKHRVNEVYRKLASWLCENNKVIFIPKFESSRLVERAARKIKSTTARSMLMWFHYAFRKILKTKAELFPVG